MYKLPVTFAEGNQCEVNEVTENWSNEGGTNDLEGLSSQYTVVYSSPTVMYNAVGILKITDEVST